MGSPGGAVELAALRRGALIHSDPMISEREIGERRGLLHVARQAILFGVAAAFGIGTGSGRVAPETNGHVRRGSACRILMGVVAADTGQPPAAALVTGTRTQAH